MGLRNIRRCLLCRREASARSSSAREKSVSTSTMKSCATVLCSIFGLPEAHPFKFIYENAQYCGPCMKEVQEVNMTVDKLELMKQNLVGFQDKIYSKLGDNYSRILDKEKLNVSFVDFEKGPVAMKGRKFSYDEIVKVLYEKLDKDKDCLKWERFSSKCNLKSIKDQEDLSSTISSPSKTDSSTQTESCDGARVITKVGHQMKNCTTATIKSQNNQVNIPDSNDDDAWGVDTETDGGVCEGLDDNFDDGGASGGGSDVEKDSSTNVVQEDLCFADLPPEAVDLFNKAPPNFENKIYCTFDPENCKRFFYDNYNLGVHVKSFHEGNPLPHECSICKKGFIEEGRLKNHILRVHSLSNDKSKNKSEMCDQCGKDFKSKKSLQYHVHKVHEKVAEKETHSCRFCTAPFPTLMELEDHENKHRSLSVPFGCVYCSESFPNSGNLKNHFIRHHTENVFCCDICGNRLCSQNALNKHILTHSNKFKCEQCDYRGSSKHGLRIHMMTHSGEKQHSCEICGKLFMHIKNLNVHRRLHTGEKPYTCSICQMTFRESSYLRRHEEAHSSTPNYQCDVCGAEFKVKENMQNHKRKHKDDYVPKKKKHKPRTEEQKLTRRLKEQQNRLVGWKMVDSNDILAPATGRTGKQPRSPRRSFHKRKVNKKKPAGTCSGEEMGGAMSVKQEEDILISWQ